MLFRGIYYPVIGSSNGWINAQTTQAWLYRVFGWESKYSFYIGIKCRLFNREKPYRQFVIDVFDGRLEMTLKTRYHSQKDGSVVPKGTPDSFKMISAQTHDGKYIGTILDGYHIRNLTGLDNFDGDGNGTVCVGWDETAKKAYGWSHRAMVGFTHKDMVFEEDFGDENTPYREHGRETIRTPEQAMKSAKAFARSVS